MSIEQGKFESTEENEEKVPVSESPEGKEVIEREEDLYGEIQHEELLIQYQMEDFENDSARTPPVYPELFY